MPALEPIDVLSDDEKLNEATAPGSQPKSLGRPLHHQRFQPRRARFAIRAGQKHLGPCDDPKHLANLIRRTCGCQCDCFASFRRHDTLLAEWMKLRKMLRKMRKLEKDDYVRVLQFEAWYSDIQGYTIQLSYKYLDHIMLDHIPRGVQAPKSTRSRSQERRTASEAAGAPGLQQSLYDAAWSWHGSLQHLELCCTSWRRVLPLWWSVCAPRKKETFRILGEGSLFLDPNVHGNSRAHPWWIEQQQKAPSWC